MRWSWLPLMLLIAARTGPTDEPAKPADTLQNRVGTRVTFEAAIIGAHERSQGSYDDNDWDQTGNGIGVALRVGGMTAPSAFGGRLGLHYGVGFAVLGLATSTSTTFWGGLVIPLRSHNSGNIAMSVVNAYVGVHGLVGRTGVDGVWRGVLLGIDYDPGLLFGDGLKGITLPLQLKAFSIQATWFKPDAPRAHPQLTFRLSLSPPLSSNSTATERDIGAHDVDPWVTTLSVGAAWY